MGGNELMLQYNDGKIFYWMFNYGNIYKYLYCINK